MCTATISEGFTVETYSTHQQHVVEVIDMQLLRVSSSPMFNLEDDCYRLPTAQNLVTVSHVHEARKKEHIPRLSQ